MSPSSSRNRKSRAAILQAARQRTLRFQTLQRRELLAGDSGWVLLGTGEGEGENMQPSFVASPPPTINEDVGAQALDGFASFDPGDPSESSQNVLAYQVFDVTNPDLFDTLPAIDNQGRLTYTPAANAYGTSRFSVTVQDDGGTASGGVDTSATQSFFLTINPVNDPPTISVGGPVAVGEDSGAASVADFVTAFHVGPSEDGTLGGTRTIHDEGSDGTTHPLSADNLNPTNLGTLNPGDNTVMGHIEAARSVGDVDVFTVVVAAGTQLDALFVDAFDGGPDQRGFLAVDDTNSFPYSPDQLSNNNPNFDPNAFIGGTLFGAADLGNATGSGILTRLGSDFGSGFVAPLGPGTYTFYVQQTGPATTYSLRLRVSQTSSQSFQGYSVGSVSDTSLFETLPAIDANGTLTFTPAANAFGTVTFEVFAQDDGGTANGGVDTSVASTASITINPINDAPTITTLDEVVSREDNGATTIADFVTSFDPGPNESGTSSEIQLLHDEGTDGTTDPLSTDNLNPTDVGSLVLGANIVRGYLEPSQSTGNVDVFTFTVPEGHLWSGVFVEEYSYVQTPSNPNERNAFFAINDANSFPYNTFELDINNNPFLDETAFLGGTIFGLSDLPENGGGGNILPRAGVIAGRRFTGPLSAGTYTIYVQQTGSANRYALDLRVTLENAQQPLEYSVSNVADPSLFSVLPTVSADGTLSFTPADDAVGSTTFEVTVQDNGGTDNGGVDQSNVTTSTLTLQGVNDPPGFMASDPPTILRDSGDQVVPDWATGFVSGPADESNQSVLAYLVNNISIPTFFATEPTVTASGTLAYSVNPGVQGSVTFEVAVQDDGGTLDGGEDTSASQTFTLTVNDQLDFGDAPAGYPTTFDDDGARHSINSLFLGQGVSSELDGQPSDNADADAEDDGVTQPILLIASIDQQTLGFVDVVSSAIGTLQAWIDFNQDGDWSDPEEQIASDVSLDPGTHRITFAIPAGSVAGTTFARFRISTQSSLGVTGEAPDGEVEDHAIELLDSAVPHDASFPWDGDGLTVIAGLEFIAIRDSTGPLWTVPSSSINQFQVQGSDTDQTITVVVPDGDSGFPAGLHFDGGSGSNTLVLVGATDLVDLTSSGDMQIQNFERFDLQDQVANRIRIDIGSFVNDLGANALLLVGDEGDQIEFADPDQWQLGSTRVENGQFFQSLTTVAGLPVIEVALPTAWQNLIRPSDVNNDSQITALDALVIINELARSAYSDESTGLLVSPESLSPWPGVYYDRTGDGSISALDALQIINELARISRSGEGEGLVPNLGGSLRNSPNARALTETAAIDQALGELDFESRVSSKIADFARHDESSPKSDEGRSVSETNELSDVIAEEIASLKTLKP